MSKRKRCRRQGSATDLPFQSKGRREIRPNDTGTLLRLKVWRLQQASAKRLRALVRENAKRLPSLDAVENSIGSHVGHGILREANRQALARRFVSAGSQPMQDVMAHEFVAGPGLQSTVRRRLTYAVRSRVERFFRSLGSALSVVRGVSCALCGGLNHGSFSCYDALSSAIRRNDELVVVARRRLMDVSLTPGSSAFHDDVMRIAALERDSEMHRMRRGNGLLWWATRILRQGLRSTPLYLINSVLGNIRLWGEIWYIAFGERYSPFSRRIGFDLSRFGSMLPGLLDFAADVTRSTTVDRAARHAALGVPVERTFSGAPEDEIATSETANTETVHIQGLDVILSELESCFTSMRLLHARAYKPRGRLPAGHSEYVDAFFKQLTGDALTDSITWGDESASALGASVWLKLVKANFDWYVWRGIPAQGLKGEISLISDETGEKVYGLISFGRSLVTAGYSTVVLREYLVDRLYGLN